MDKKHIRFYQNFHKAFQGKKLNHCFVQVSDGGIRKGFSVDQDQSEKESFPTYPHKNMQMHCLIFLY